MGNSHAAKISKRITPFVFILPSIFVFLLFYIYPIFYMFRVSFYDWNFISKDPNFIGLDNYRELLTSSEFRQVLGNTFMYSLVTVGVTILIALLLGYWMNSEGRKYKVVQAFIFSPHITSWVAISFIWMLLMDPNYGLFNTALEAMNLPASEWLQSPDTALPSLMLIGIWKLVGYDTLIIASAIKGIPSTVIEAAKLDQTPPFRMFTKVILPMISPSIFFLLVMNSIMSFQTFDTVSIMTQGGPLNSTNTLVYFIYENGFRFFKMGYASAAGMILLLILIVLTAVYFKLLERQVDY